LALGKEALAVGRKKGKDKEIRRYPATLFHEISPFKMELREEDLEGALGSAEKEVGPLRRVKLLLPENSFLINFVELPQVPDSTYERQKMLHFYMSKRLHWEGDVAVTYHHLGEGKFLVATMALSNLLRLKEFFEKRRVKLRSVKPASISALNYFLGRGDVEAFSFVFPVDGFAVIMGGRGGRLEVYRRIRPPFEEKELLEELELIDRFLQVETDKFLCRDSLDLSGFQILEEPCWKLPVLGEIE